MTFNTIFQRITHTIHLHSCPNPSFAYECREAFAIIQNSTKGYASTCPYPPHSPNYPPQTHTHPTTTTTTKSGMFFFVLGRGESQHSIHSLLTGCIPPADGPAEKNKSAEKFTPLQISGISHHNNREPSDSRAN